MTTSASDLVSATWGSEARLVVEAECQWTELPAVRANLAIRASGDPAVDWLQHSAQYVAALGRPARALSLGGGFGFLERRLRSEGIVQTVHGIDLAPGAIEGARRLADEAGLTGLTYEVGDLNTITLPEHAYDVVYARSSLHHVFQLEHLLGQIRRTLAPDGLLIVSDYVGPSYLQFPTEHLLLADDLLSTLPERLRINRRVGGIQRNCYRFLLKMFEDEDPSEAVRASELLSVIATRFKIEYARALGGTLQYLVFSDIVGNFKDDDAEAQAHVARIIDTDNRLVDAGIVPSYHAYLVCRRTDNPSIWHSNGARLAPTPRLAVHPVDADQMLVEWHTASGPGRVCLTVEGEPALAFPPGIAGQRLVQIVDEIPPPPRRPFVVADPNPVPPATSRTTIRWEADDVAELRVSTDGGPETVMAIGNVGELSGDWINPGQTYTLRMYSHVRGTLLHECIVYQGAAAPLWVPRGRDYTFTLMSEDGHELARTVL